MSFIIFKRYICFNSFEVQWKLTITELTIANSEHQKAIVARAIVIKRIFAHLFLNISLTNTTQVLLLTNNFVSLPSSNFCIFYMVNRTSGCRSNRLYQNIY